MDQQPSIFDEQFDLDIPKPRRELLSGVLKVLLWIIMGGAAVMVLLMLATVFCIFFWPEQIVHGISDRGSIILGVAIFLVLLTPVFLMTFLVWREVKWAIKFNKVVFALWVVSVGLMAIFSGVAIIQLMTPTAIILLPYWIMLFRIQRKWEQ